MDKKPIHAIIDCFYGGREAAWSLFAYSYHLLSDLAQRKDWVMMPLYQEYEGVLYAMYLVGTFSYIENKHWFVNGIK